MSPKMGFFVNDVPFSKASEEKLLLWDPIWGRELETEYFPRDFLSKRSFMVVETNNLRPVAMSKESFHKGSGCSTVVVVVVVAH